MKKALYDLAYGFRNAKPWKRIDEEDLFAVALPGGQIGYCCLMGRNGEHMALAVYVGEAGFSSYRTLMNYNTGRAMSDVNPVELLTQDCIQCSIEARDQFSPEELEEIRAYCKASGVPFRAPFPQFTRFYPYCVPWHIAEPSDWQIIAAALRITNRLEECLKTARKEEMGLRAVAVNLEGEFYIDSFGRHMRLFPSPQHAQQKEAVTIPLYAMEEEELCVSRIPLPPYKAPAVQPPDHLDEIAIAKLRRLKQKDVFECEIMRLPEPVAGEPPYVPAILLSVNADTGFILPPVVSEGARYDPGEMLKEYIHCLLTEGVYPRQIMVRTDETATLLKPFCDLAHINFSVCRELDVLDEAAAALRERKSRDSEIEQVISMLDQMSVEEMRQIPQSMLEQLLQTKEILPVRIVGKIRKALKK